MSFVMLSDSQFQLPRPISNGSSNAVGVEKASPTAMSTSNLSAHNHSLSDRMESSARFFEIISARSDIDHPICAECTDVLLSSLQARLASSTKERDAYIMFLKEVKNNIPTDAEVTKAEHDLEAAKKDESAAFAELLALEKEKDQLEQEFAVLDANALELDKEEEEFWRARNAFALILSSIQDSRDAFTAAYNHDAQQLDRLQRTNVYNDTFCIGHDGNFGTINGLRLGRLSPPNNVEWVEINAAWGATALLLATVAGKLGFSFHGYRVSPMGSTSHIDKVDYPPQASPLSSTMVPRATATTAGPAPKVTALELFSSGDLPLGRTILHRRFNEAMVAFLECLRQLGEFVEKGDPQAAPLRGQQSGGLKLPYQIDRDKIGGLSIKLGISQDEAWTSACKYTLTCCKFLLAHASNVAGAGGASRRGGS
jgi:beclin 1